LRNRYDYIIMEGSSLNDYSDTRELAHFADLVIPVFSAESAITEEDRAALHFLRALNGQLARAFRHRWSGDERSMAAAFCWGGVSTCCRTAGRRRGYGEC